MVKKRKIRKRTLKKAEPALKLAGRLGEVLGEIAVVGGKKAKTTVRKTTKVTATTIDSMVKKGKGIMKTVTEVAPEVAKELRAGVKRGVKKGKKRR